MEVEINWLAVLLAALANMVIGGIWYMPQVFGAEWQKIIGLKEKQLKEGAPKAMFGAAVLAVVTAYILAHVTYLSQSFFDQSFLSAGISTGFWMWLGFGLTVLATQGLFEQRPFRWTAIVTGNLLVAFLAMGWIIGALGV